MDGQEYLSNGVGRAPVILENIQTNCTLTAYIAMVDACLEDDLGWFKGVLLWESHVEVEYSALFLFWGGWGDRKGQEKGKRGR